LNEKDQYLHSYIILGIVAVILSFNIVLVLFDTFESLYEVFQYIKKRGVLTYIRTQYYQSKLKLALKLPKPVLRIPLANKFLNVQEIAKSL